MPVVSRAQFRYMQWREHQPPKKERREKGASASVAREFLTATPKGAYERLPERVKKK